MSFKNSDTCDVCVATEESKAKFKNIIGMFYETVGEYLNMVLH